MGGPDAPRLPQTDSRELPARCAHLGLARGVRSAGRDVLSKHGAPSKQGIRGSRSEEVSPPPELSAPPRPSLARFYFCFQPLFGIPS